MNPRAPTLNECLEEVARFYAITEDTLKGPSRRRSYARPRMLFYWLARQCTRHSTGEIAEFCGGRDHSSICDGSKAITKLMRFDRELDLIARTLKERLTRQPTPKDPAP